MRTLTAVTFGVLLSACAARPPAGELRFHNRPPVTVVNDRLPVARKPAERKYYRNFIWAESHFQGRLTRWMEMRPQRRAGNVNAMDEVPDSTWFTNRIGARDLTVAEIRRGPNAHGSPEKHLPFTIKSSKVGGVAVGFIAEDARGDKYLLKFDMIDFPESEAPTDVVVQRLLWAAGYNVPEDYVVFLHRQDLKLAKDAVVEDPMGGKEPMSREFVDLQLSKIHVEKDGTIRALASRYLDGKPLGGHPREGVREDDPNDRIPYQLRREVRGAYALFAWLDHTDMKEDNTLDMYVADPGNKKVHYVVHYLVDFGKALGMQSLTSRNKAGGESYALDLGDSALSLVSLGLWKRRWEDRRWPDIPGVGIFESETYEPGKWKPNSPQYVPFLDADRFDNFWSAKILIRFSRAQLRAAVEQGRYSDPRAMDYITRVLVERQRKTARHWFARVAPLDRFAVEADGAGPRLCFEDLSLRYRLERSAPGQTRYAARAFAGDGRRLPWSVVTTGTRDGRVCLPRLAGPAPGRDGYTIIRIATRRPGQNLPDVLVHMARDPLRGTLRVIGLRRL